jgi:hypothetical protein
MIWHESPEHFFTAFADFLHQGYSVSVRYIALLATDGSMYLVGLSVSAGPLPVDESLSFSIQSPYVMAGQMNSNGERSEDILSILKNGANGAFSFGREEFKFWSRPYCYSSELEDSKRWEYDAHLKGEVARGESGKFDFASIDRFLRIADIPFDGISDLALWLDLPNPSAEEFSPSIDLRVRPPIDCFVHESFLRNDELSLTVGSHPVLDISEIRLAVRSVPGHGLNSRQQIANQLKWSQLNTAANVGRAVVKLENADAVLVILSFAGKTIRRQWFNDPVRARNSRTFASRHFDFELRQVRKALLEGSDSTKFELAVSSLLFMLGFAPALQLETDAPDIIATTPGGQLILIECTLRTADFAMKVGKLVDRRNSLRAQFDREKHFAHIHALLICRVRLEQIVYDEDSLRKLGIRLVSLSDLESALQKVNIPDDPDAYFTNEEI